MRQATTGLLLVVSGPAGVGKGTINAELMKRHPEIKMSVSATTRAPRPGEVNGVHYFFKTPDEFRKMIEDDAFLEYMHVFGMNYYGTPRDYVFEQLDVGNHVILEIDVNGARKVKQAFPEAIRVFIAPPSLAELRKRLEGRGTETPEQVERRTLEAYTELKDMPSCDYVIVNDDLETAVRQLEAIVVAEQCSALHNAEVINTFLGGMES